MLPRGLWPENQKPIICTGKPDGPVFLTDGSSFDPLILVSKNQQEGSSLTEKLRATNQEEAKLATIISTISASLTDPQKIIESFASLEKLEGLDSYLFEFERDYDMPFKRSRVRAIIRDIKAHLKTTDLLSAVFHEAGHAVVANLCGFNVSRVSVSMDWQIPDCGDEPFELLYGATATSINSSSTEKWVDDRIKEREFLRIHAYFRDSFMVLAAGQFHENAFLHLPCKPQSGEFESDRKQAAELLKAWLDARNQIFGIHDSFSEEQKQQLLDGFWDYSLQQLAFLMIPYESREILMGFVKELGEKLLLGINQINELLSRHNRKNGGRTAYRPRPDLQSYYKSSEWIGLSKRVKERDGFKCATCGDTNEQLNVHHIHYDSRDPEIPGRENMEDLITLCRHCHVLFHAMLRGTLSPSDIEQLPEFLKPHIKAGSIPQFDFYHLISGTAENVLANYFISQGGIPDLQLTVRGSFIRAFHMSWLHMLGYRVMVFPEDNTLYVEAGDETTGLKKFLITDDEELLSALKSMGFGVKDFIPG
jgi:5-methylcytosine-specific restriction endonuclease McrA